VTGAAGSAITFGSGGYPRACRARPAARSTSTPAAGTSVNPAEGDARPAGGMIGGWATIGNPNSSDPAKPCWIFATVSGGVAAFRWLRNQTTFNSTDNTSVSKHAGPVGPDDDDQLRFT